MGSDPRKSVLNKFNQTHEVKTSSSSNSRHSLARLKLGLAGRPETYFVLGSRANVINALPLAMAIYCLPSLT